MPILSTLPVASMEPDTCHSGDLHPEGASVEGNQLTLESNVICLIMFITNVKTFNNGSLGSRIDEERSEMR
jgi:hypothetical protein